MGSGLGGTIEVGCGVRGSAGRSPCDEVAPPTRSVGALPAAAGLRPACPPVTQKTEVRSQRLDFDLLPPAPTNAWQWHPIPVPAFQHPTNLGRSRRLGAKPPAPSAPASTASPWKRPRSRAVGFRPACPPATQKSEIRVQKSDSDLSPPAPTKARHSHPPTPKKFLNLPIKNHPIISHP